MRTPNLEVSHGMRWGSREKYKWKYGRIKKYVRQLWKNRKKIDRRAVEKSSEKRVNGQGSSLCCLEKGFTGNFVIPLEVHWKRWLHFLGGNWKKGAKIMAGYEPGLFCGVTCLKMEKTVFETMLGYPTESKRYKERNIVMYRCRKKSEIKR